MIPEFPRFKRLELSDKPSVEAMTATLPPYSDFNFVSMWSWDIHVRMQVSQYSGALIVRFTDYLTGQEFQSFCGGASPSDVAQALLAYEVECGRQPMLRLIPAETAAAINGNNFIVCEDRDHFDYIVALGAIGSDTSLRSHNRNRQAARFRRSNKTSTRRLDLNSRSTQSQIEELVEKWAGLKKLTCEEMQYEQRAMRRLFECSSIEQFVALGVFEESALIGFSIVEPVDGEYVMSHFQKADRRRPDIYPFIMQETADVLLASGYRYLNCQQDLGLPGLRHSKLSYHPETYLKKFEVLPRDERFGFVAEQTTASAI